MKNAAVAVAALCAGAVFAPLAAAQPGIRNAIVYAARAVGETDWHTGSLSLQSPDTSPLMFEIGVFFFRAQGAGFSTAAYKTYVNILGDFSFNDNSAMVIDDPSNGFSPEDGRQSVYNSGAQTQKVFTNRHATIPNFGFRLSSTADSADASAAGGISVKQAGPLGPNFHTGDGELGYRFNLTLGFNAGGRTALVHTPLNRINSYTTYNTLDSNTTTEFKSTVVVENLTLHASWVPTPATVGLFGLALFCSARRRRGSVCSQSRAPTLPIGACR